MAPLTSEEAVARYGWDPSQPASYIMYWDANNLYGGAMSDPLPLGEFQLQEGGDVNQPWALSSLWRQGKGTGPWAQVA